MYFKAQILKIDQFYIDLFLVFLAVFVYKFCQNCHFGWREWKGLVTECSSTSLISSPATAKVKQMLWMRILFIFRCSIERHIEAETKLLPFHRRHFEVHFLKMKMHECRLRVWGSMFWRFQLTMMMSSNGNILCDTGHLCGEFTGHRWIPLTKASDAELWCFLWSALE